MKIPLSWLDEWVPCKHVPLEELTDIFTHRGFPVESAKRLDAECAFERHHALRPIAAAELETDLGPFAGGMRSLGGFGITEITEHRTLGLAFNEGEQQPGRVGTTASTWIVLRIGNQNRAACFGGDLLRPRHGLRRREYRDGERCFLERDVARGLVSDPIGDLLRCFVNMDVNSGIEFGGKGGDAGERRVRYGVRGVRRERKADPRIVAPFVACREALPKVIVGVARVSDRRAWPRTRA